VEILLLWSLPAGDFGHAVATQLKMLLPDIKVLAVVAQGGLDTLLQDTSAGG